jgi:DNA-binding SARP family transcriptional activator
MMSRQYPPRVLLLVPFRLVRDGRSVRLPTRKAEALLAFLLLNPQPHSRERRAALFWGDSPTTRANGSLRIALSALRQQLGQSALLVDRQTALFNPAFPVRVDVRDLEAPIAEPA